jgi:hypothetical protein
MIFGVWLKEAQKAERLSIKKARVLGIRTGSQRVSSLATICLAISETSNVDLYATNAVLQCMSSACIEQY